MLAGHYLNHQRLCPGVVWGVLGKDEYAVVVLEERIHGRARDDVRQLAIQLDKKSQRNVTQDART